MCSPKTAAPTHPAPSPNEENPSSRPIIAIYADIDLDPNLPNRGIYTSALIALQQLADYIDADSALTLSPGDIQSHTQYLVDVAHGRYKGANLFTLFDTTELLNAINENGRLTITISGQLKQEKHSPPLTP